MAADAIDTTAIAAIVIGLGGTVAAMVYPIKYPGEQKWAVNLSWWGGLFFVLSGVIYLVTEHLGGAIVATLGLFLGYIIALLHMTAFWLVMVFAAGMAAHRWGLPLILTWRIQAQVDRSPIVTTWQTPLQAAERFVDPDLFSKYRTAQENAKSLAEKVKLLEVELAGAVESEIISVLKKHLTDATGARDDADYVAQRRRADVVESLRVALKSQILVAKRATLQLVGNAGLWRDCSKFLWRLRHNTGNFCRPTQVTSIFPAVLSHSRGVAQRHE